MDGFNVSNGDRTHDKKQCKTHVGFHNIHVRHTAGQGDSYGRVTRLPGSMELALGQRSGLQPEDSMN